MRRHGLILALLLLARAASAAPGTEFWAAFSDDGLAPADTLLVWIGNPDPTAAANVTIETEAGPVAASVVAPLSTHVFDLTASRKVVATVLSRQAYRVRSDIPVHAYQGNAISGTTKSGSLLPARRTFGKEYLALTRPSITASWPGRRSIVTIVAPGPARVTVVPASATDAGPSVPALAAGATYSADLEAFDVLQFAAAGIGDLTGTSVSSTGPIEVFARCLYCNIGNSQTPQSASNHMEELMPPIAWWGTNVIAAASNPLTNDINIWRILASADATAVSTDPPMPGTPAVIDRGKFVEFESAADFAVTASLPILVGRYNSAGVPPGGFCSGGCAGPTLALMLPAERFFSRAVYSLPTGSQIFETLDIVASSGTAVSVDGKIVPAASFIPVGASGCAHAQLQLPNPTAAHSIVADQPIAAYAMHAYSGNAVSFPVDIEPPPDLAPSCSAGGPYVVACTGPPTVLPLDGTASKDPEDAPLTHRWSSSATQLAFDDSKSATPAATVNGVGTFPVDLEVDDGAHKTKCSTTIQVNGDASTPPELDRIAVPLLAVKLGGGIAFSWQDLGSAEVRYNVYEGTMKLIDSHAPLACNVAGTQTPPSRRELTITPGAGSRYYLISAANCAAEGPSGLDPAMSTCPP